MNTHIGKTRILAVIVGLLNPVAYAEEPRVAVIAMDNCEVAASAPHARNYRQSLQARLGGDVQAEATTIVKLGGSSSSMSIAEVERLLSGATADRFQDQVDRAARTLEGVVGDVERLPPTPARYRALMDVLAALGHIQLLRGKNGEADAAKYFTRILRVDPTWSPSVNFYPPSTIAFVTKLRRKLEKAEKVTLKVSTRPPGKTVFIDTRPVGESPISVQIAPESASLLVDADWGGERRGLARSVKVEQASDIELDAAFEGAIFADRACAQSDGTREGRLALATRLASPLNAKTIHVLWEDEPSSHERYLTVVSVNYKGEQALEARIRVHAGGVRLSVFDSLVNFMLTGEAGPPVEPVRSPVGHPKLTVRLPEAKPAPLPIAQTINTAERVSPRRASPWISGAIGAAAGAASGLLLFLADGSAKKAEQTCPQATVCSSLDASQLTVFRAQHQSQTVGAISLMVTAGVAIAATVAFVLWNIISDREALSATSNSTGASLKP